MNQWSEMRWWHLGLFGMIGYIWHWANRHVKYFRARINGYTVEKAEKVDKVEKKEK